MKFEQQTELITYVEDQISQALPSGWFVRREELGVLSWVIAARKPAKAVEESYRLRVSSDFALFVLEHGNTDLGPFGLGDVLLNAKVIDAGGLDHFPLSAAIRSVFDECQPNEWGWT